MSESTSLVMDDNEDREPNNNSHVVNGREKHMDMSVFWKFFCLLAGQYINYERSPKWKCFSVFGLVWFVLQLIVCSGYVGTVLAIEGLRIANHSFPINITDNNSTDCKLPQEHWKFTTAVYY